MRTDVTVLSASGFTLVAVEERVRSHGEAAAVCEALGPGVRLFAAGSQAPPGARWGAGEQEKLPCVERNFKLSLKTPSYSVFLLPLQRTS